MRRTRMPFAVMLPLLELIVWVLAVLLPVSFAYLNARQPVRHRAPRRQALPDAAPPLADGTPLAMQARPTPPQSPGAASLYVGTALAGNAIAGLNLPAMSIEILTSLPTTWPGSWVPFHLYFLTWRALIFPIYCLPAWWLAGRGLDAWVRGRKLPKFMVILSGILSCLFAFLATGLWFGNDHSEPDPIMRWIFVGFFLWTVLFAAAPIGWFRWRKAWRSEIEAQPNPAV